MIKYKNAYDPKGNLIHINEITSESRSEKYNCINCNSELIPRIGKVRQKHFAHKITQKCSGETYLHTLGKNTFIETYNKCLKSKTPFYIELYQKNECDFYKRKFNITCDLGEKIVKVDLTKFYTNIYEEKKEGSFRPDILLEGDGNIEKLFIEINVTHSITSEKENSNYRIIEILINNEEDVEIIKRKILNQNQQALNFFNFKNIKKENICKGDCLNKNQYSVFVVAQNGMCIIYHKTLKDFDGYIKHYKKQVQKFEFIERHQISEYKIFVANAFKDGLNVKNCFICNSYSKNTSNNKLDLNKNPVYCLYNNSKGNSNRAVNCDTFIPNEIHVSNIITSQENRNTQVQDKSSKRNTSDLSIGDNFRKKNQNLKAIIFYTKHLKSNNDSKAFFNRGEIRMELYAYKDAFSDLNQALKIGLKSKKDQGAAFLYIAYCKKEFGEKESAYNYLKRALDLGEIRAEKFLKEWS